MTPKNAEFFPTFLSFALKMARILERTFMIRAVFKSLKTTDITEFMRNESDKYLGGDISAHFPSIYGIYITGLFLTF